jgi:hypothetical protein
MTQALYAHMNNKKKIKKNPKTELCLCGAMNSRKQQITLPGKTESLREK